MLNSPEPLILPPENTRRPGAAASVVVLAIAVILVLAHLYRVLVAPDGTLAGLEFLVRYALIPAYVPENPIALFTHMGVHGDWLHLGLNTAFFIMLGLVLARRIGDGAVGALKMLVLILASGFAGGLTVFALAPGSETPTVGFSGAVFGVAAAFFLSMRPDWRDSLRDRAVQANAFWFLAINMGLAFGLGAAGAMQIAWEAHLGGFIGGAVAWMALAPRVARRLQGGPWR